MANSKKIYDDRSAEVKELTFIIKKELTGLTQKIGNLKAIQNEREDGRTGATEDHQNGVVSMLQGQLANASSRFTQVLQISSSNMRAQRDRREQFGSMAVPVQQAANGPSQRSLTKQRSGIASREEQREQHVSIEMPFQKMAIAEQVHISTRLMIFTVLGFISCILGQPQYGTSRHRIDHQRARHHLPATSPPDISAGRGCPEN